MSNKRNKEIEHHDSESEDDQGSDSERDSDLDSDGNYVGDKELQADFEGRNPEDCDHHGIKQLLRQLFLKSDVELGALSQIIISQNYIGSVVKQCLDNGLEDEDDDDDDGSDGVFGVTTVINITKRKDEKCIEQIRNLLVTLAEDNANDKTKALVKKILTEDASQVGLVINERILNIPAAISVPLFSSLQAELEKAVRKNMPYTFQYLVWICKTYNTGESSEVLFANQEEKPLADVALASFDVDVTEQAELSQWDYDGGALTPCRKVLIFDGSKFNQLIRLIKEEVEGV